MPKPSKTKRRASKRRARGAAPRRTGREQLTRRSRGAFDRVRATERGIKVVGERTLKPGPVRVARSRLVTPTTRGAGSKSVRRTLKRITDVPASPFYTYSVEVRFRGRNRKRRVVKVQGIGVPRLKDAARQRRRSKKTGKMETAKQALRRIVMANINRQVHATIREEWGKYDLGDTTTPMGRKKARAQLARIKRRQQATFRIEFQRIVRSKGR